MLPRLENVLHIYHSTVKGNCVTVASKSILLENSSIYCNSSHTPPLSHHSKRLSEQSEQHRKIRKNNLHSVGSVLPPFGGSREYLVLYFFYNNFITRVYELTMISDIYTCEFIS